MNASIVHLGLSATSMIGRIERSVAVWRGVTTSSLQCVEVMGSPTPVSVICGSPAAHNNGGLAWFHKAPAVGETFQG